MKTREQMQKELQNEIETAFLEKYGPEPAQPLCNRLQEEWSAIKKTGQESNFLLLLDLSQQLKDVPHWMSFSSGSSFILYLLKIVQGNPLPPHYLCPRCHQVQFIDDCADGFDLPDKYCSADHTLLERDGHDIPCRPYWCYNGNPAWYRINLPIDFLEKFRPILEARLPFYLGDGIPLKEREIDLGLYGKEIILKAENFSFNFCLDKKHWQPKSLQDLIVGWPRLYQESEQLRNFPAPKTFSDLLKIEGMSHSVYVKDPLTEDVLKRDGLKEVFTCREDVYRCLRSHGFSEEDAVAGMERVRKGRGLPTDTEKILEAEDSRITDQCKNISYLPPEGMSLECLIYRMEV